MYLAYNNKKHVFNDFKNIAEKASFITLPVFSVEVVFGQDSIFMYQPHEDLDFHWDFSFP
jgi:hypothetical protein